MDSRPTTAEPSNKRPPSPTVEQAHLAKVPKTHSNHLQINYLARQYPDNLPLVSSDDTMPAIIHLLGEYDGVLQRHESIAGNLGACPLGPILIKRFERLFDGPPRVLKSHGKDGPTVTWLDVVEFAKSKPEQFNLEKSRNGVRVCQFYTKQCRVEISEEDFVLIASGMPQKMIPPQPIIEDEEKELGGLEILEKNLQQIIQMADQVSARGRQLSYRLKNRRTAIMTRRQNDASLQSRNPADIWRDVHGNTANAASSGFLSVNANRSDETEENSLSSPFMFSQSNTDNVTIINGTSIKGASPTTRADLMKRFFTTADRQARGYDEPSGPINPQPQPQPQSRAQPGVSEPAEYSIQSNTNTTPVAIPGTPSSLLPPPKSTSQEKDDGGPFKLEMIARMEEHPRGERLVPPCDRCRRLHMDCVKNLTACMGCTKKHAKCSWRDVREDELRSAFGALPPRERIEDGLPRATSRNPAPPTNGPSSEHPRQTPLDSFQAHHNRRESAPGAPHIGPGSGASMGQSSREDSPRRAMSETEGRGPPNGLPLPRRHREEDDPGANQRLMQAILDTVDHHARVAAAVEQKERGAERVGERAVERVVERGGERGEENSSDRDTDRDRERRMVHA